MSIFELMQNKKKLFSQNFSKKKVNLCKKQLINKKMQKRKSFQNPKNN